MWTQILINLIFDTDVHLGMGYNLVDAVKIPRENSDKFGLWPPVTFFVGQH